MRRTTTATNSEVVLYLQEIGKFKLLTAKEERELAYRVAAGDMEARDCMIRANLRLVVSIAKNYMNRGMAFADLIEEGNLGLLKAVARFSPDQGCKFSTYASWWIKQTIRRSLINKVKAVRIPAYMIETLIRWKRASALLTQKLGREPDTEEIRKYLKLSSKKIAAIQKALLASAPIDYGNKPARTFDPDAILANVPSRADNCDLPGEYDREALRIALDYALTDRERHILELRYGLAAKKIDHDHEPLTLEKIAKRIGLTRERVRQVEHQALHKLQLFLQQKNQREEEQRLKRQRAHVI